MQKECGTCRTPLFEGQERGTCNECSVHTCVHCSRNCERCTKIVCWNHLSSTNLIIYGQMSNRKLCNVCRLSLAGYVVGV